MTEDGRETAIGGEATCRGEAVNCADGVHWIGYEKTVWVWMRTRRAEVQVGTCCTYLAHGGRLTL